MTTSTWRITIHAGCAPREREGSGADRIRRIGPIPTIEELAQPIVVDHAERQTARFLATARGGDLALRLPHGRPAAQTRDFDRNYPLTKTLPGSDYYAVEASAGNPVDRCRT